MVFKKIKDMMNAGRESRELEQFTPKQKQRIFERITKKEEELIRDAEDKFVDQRIQRLESRLGMIQPSQLVGRKRFRAQRLANLERQKQRTKTFFENEKKFREGKLTIKPVGPTPKKFEKKSNVKLNVKPLKLRAPKNGI